jgi:hypothetical protein
MIALVESDRRAPRESAELHRLPLGERDSRRPAEEDQDRTRAYPDSARPDLGQLLLARRRIP